MQYCIKLCRATGLFFSTAYGYIKVTFNHSSAGIGWTGTYIALDYLLDEGEEQDWVDVPDCLHKLRHARINMVENLVGENTLAIISHFLCFDLLHNSKSITGYNPVLA